MNVSNETGKTTGMLFMPLRLYRVPHFIEGEHCPKNMRIHTTDFLHYGSVLSISNSGVDSPEFLFLSLFPPGYPCIPKEVSIIIFRIEIYQDITLDGFPGANWGSTAFSMSSESGTKNMFHH